MLIKPLPQSGKYLPGGRIFFSFAGPHSRPARLAIYAVKTAGLVRSKINPQRKTEPAGVYRTIDIQVFAANHDKSGFRVIDAGF
jgi:hypothetical protein